MQNDMSCLPHLKESTIHKPIEFDAHLLQRGRIDEANRRTEDRNEAAMWEIWEKNPGEIPKLSFFQYFLDLSVPDHILIT